MTEHMNDFQALLYNASRLLSKITQQPIVKNGVSDEDPLDLDDLAEISDAVARAVNPIFKHIAEQGGLEDRYGGFATLVSDLVNDEIGSELRSKAQNIREEEPGIGSNEADDRWKMRREPAL